jgi:phospholipid/cholesterol/gamma-HCH transport system ATP-binding protein
MARLMVEVKNLSKSFGDHIVLNNISFKVDEGENFVVFGRSGTGKSVLLKCMVGLLEPDSGDILINGKSVVHIPIKEMNELRKRIGFLFQGSALYDSMTVRENLEFPLVRNFNFSAKEREAKVIDVLEKVGLSKAIDKKPAELSGGMKKRVGLARTIITEPELILYDEPTTGLDPITAKEISQLIVELQKDLNITAIVVTHDLICAKIVADSSIVLRAGKIVYEGEIKGLEKADDPFLKNFFSSELVDVDAGEI